MTSNQGSMNPSSFIAEVAREVAAYFRNADNLVRSSVRSRLAQFWWGGDHSVHYELWVHERTLQLELGLHMESSAARNAELYKSFGQHLIEIQGVLGDTLWLEEWDKGWVRLYETVPLFPLDDARVYSVAGRLCEIMECLQPMYESLSA